MNEQKVDTAIERLRLADRMSRKYMDSPLYICISGGKDSSVIQQLAVESGLEVIFHHNHTTVDAPETVYFIRSEFARLRELGYRTQILYPKMSMWQLIESKNGMPPLRIMRYCCRYFKERPITCDRGKKAFIVTGVRWAESTRRKQRAEFEAIAKNTQNAVRIAANDNELSRKLFEDCRLRGERVCNPIIDWSDDEVWEFLNERGLPVNPLYSMGYKRVGCVGCPMSPLAQRLEQFDRYPKYKQAYINAIDRGLMHGRSLGKDYTWSCGKECFEWWMNR